jgi:hypothetical protein
VVSRSPLVDPTDGPGEVPGYEVHLVPGFRAHKRYLCPTCTQPVPEGIGHVVAWPEGFPDERRHWHRHCWRLAARSGRVSGGRDTRRDG